MPRYVNEPNDPWVLFAWTYYRDMHDELLAAVKRVIRSPAWRAAVSVEEAMGEVADRLPDVIRCYDVEKGPLDAHVMLCIKMYVHKFCRAQTQGPRAVRCGKVTLKPIDDAMGLSNAVEHRDSRRARSRVQDILEHPDMPPLFAWLLEARYVEQLTVSEIAGALHEPRKAVRRYLEDALVAARCIAGRASSGEPPSDERPGADEDVQ
jgi:hypothetical protein